MLRLIALLAFTLAAFPAQALVVREHSSIDRDKVLVGDVFDDIDAKFAEQLVGDAPQPGKSHSFDVYALKRIAKAYNVEWMPSRLDLKATVSRASTPVTNAQILDAVRNALMDKVAAADMLDIQLDRRNLELHLPAHIQAPNVRLVDVRYSSIDYRFSGSLMVESDNASDEPTILTLAGRAVPNVKVPVLSRRLNSGVVIADNDLDSVLMPINKVGGDTITDKQFLLGQELRRDLAEGLPLQMRDIRAQQLVKRGATVLMVISKGPLRVTTQGRALADGSVGENVRIMNNITNRVIEGKVQADGSVAIPAAI